MAEAPSRARAIAARRQAAAVTQRVSKVPPEYRDIVEEALAQVSEIIENLQAGDDAGQQKQGTTTFPCPGGRQPQHAIEGWPAGAEQDGFMVDGTPNAHLLTAYEELQVIQEELCQQNEELVAAREQVEAERQRYQELFDFAPDGYVVTDGSAVIQAANRAASALLNVEQTFVVGNPLALYVEEADRQALFKLVADLQANGNQGPLHAEIRLQPHQGEAFHADLVVALVAEKGEGEGVGLRWLIRDVTERKQAQLELERLLAQVHRSRQEFRALAEHAPDIIARFDRDLRHIYVNPVIEQMGGVRREELIGKSTRELGMPEELCSLWESALSEVLETGEQKTVQLTVPQEDNTWHFEARLAPEFALDGMVHTVLAVIRNVTEHVRNIEALELERATLRTVIENAPEGIIVVDKKSRIVLTNPAADQLHGRPIPYGQPYASSAEFGLCAPDGTPYDPCDLPLTVSALEGKSQRNVEMLVNWPDGQQRSLLANTAPITDGEGRSTGAVGIVQDITEEKQTRELLRLYTDRLAALREVDQAILAARSAEEIAETVLPRARKLLPCARASVALFDLEAREGTVLGVDSDMETELSRGHKVPLRDAEALERMHRGEIHFVDDVRSLPISSAMRDQFQTEGLGAFAYVPLIAEGKLLGSLNLGFAHPTSLDPEQIEIASQMASALAIGIEQARLHEEAQRRAEDLEISVARRTAALQASEARFRTIFEDSATGIALLDMEGRIVASNPALQTMLGYEARELQSKTFDDLTHPDDVEAGHALYEKLLAGEREHYYVEKRYVRRDGSIIWVRPTVSIVRHTRGGPQYAIKTVEDITEYKKAQEALILAEKLTIAGQLGASMAHEINNPLQAVIGCLGLAEESMVEGGDVGLYLRIAREELRRAARIVSQLRDLHRRTDPEEREPTDLNDLLEQVLILVRKQMETHRVEVTWEKMETPPPLMLVPDRMRQVFLNVLLNAVDAMPEGGQLRIEMAQTEEPEGIRVSFADSGMGIEPKNLAHMFEPFFSTKPAGLGLGMFIMQRIVTEHKGTVQVDSQPGEGTVITIWLPLAPANANQKEAA